jgi:hypothetical protein
MEGVQQFIPLSRGEIKRRLFSATRLDEATHSGLAQISEMLEAIYHHRMHAELEVLKELYEPMDPDSVADFDLTCSESFLETLSKVLIDGNWEEISDSEMQEALEGEDVFPISLDVRFDEFERYKLFKLGEESVEDERSSMFGLKKETVQVEQYGRVIQALQFKDSDWFSANKKREKNDPGEEGAGLLLRLFKSVPKLDLEVIFPNTSPQMRTLDKVKVSAPVIGGMVTLALKFGPIIAFALLGLGSGASGSLSVSLAGGILVGLLTYTFKSYMKYKNTKEAYLSQVSKTLYFRGLANNSAVLTSVIDLAEEQEVKEALLAYAFLHMEPDAGHTSETLDDRVEEWLRQQGVEVDFEVEDAVGKLQDLRLIERNQLSEDGKLAWNGEEWVGLDAPVGKFEKLKSVSIEQALRAMDEYWDNIFPYAND